MFKRIVLPAVFSLVVIGAVAGLAFATNQSDIPRGDRTALVAASAPGPRSGQPGASVTEPQVTAARSGTPVIARLPETVSASVGDGRADAGRAHDADAHDGDDDHDDEDEDEDEDDHDDDLAESESD